MILIDFLTCPKNVLDVESRREFLRLVRRLAV